MTTEFLSISQCASQRFEIVGEIAHGRMGVVYRVHDHALGRDVAGKFPQADTLTNTEIVRRFGDEVRITAQLQHPGIPPVFDAGTLSDGRPFMMIKLIAGTTLDTVLSKQLAVISESGHLVRIFEDICQTIAYAHFHGVVHRDLEPANVMIGAFGNIQVLDWGLALSIPKERPEAMSAEDIRRGADFGNPAYMAPEQARGEPTDFRADVFGLGALLCHMLTGAPPFLSDPGDAQLQTAANAELGGAFSRLAKCRAKKELVAIAMRCLQPRLEDRPSDAGDVAKQVTMTR